MKALIHFKRLRRSVKLYFENEEDLRTALDGKKWKDVVRELDNELRRRCKHEADEKACEIRQLLLDIITSEGVSLD